MLHYTYEGERVVVKEDDVEVSMILVVQIDHEGLYCGVQQMHCAPRETAPY